MLIELPIGSNSFARALSMDTSVYQLEQSLVEFGGVDWGRYIALMLAAIYSIHRESMKYNAALYSGLF